VDHDKRGKQKRQEREIDLKTAYTVARHGVRVDIV
jgi:hypothetical protein